MAFELSMPSTLWISRCVVTRLGFSSTYNIGHMAQIADLRASSRQALIDNGFIADIPSAVEAEVSAMTDAAETIDARLFQGR